MRADVRYKCHILLFSRLFINSLRRNYYFWNLYEPIIHAILYERLRFFPHQVLIEKLMIF